VSAKYRAVWMVLCEQDSGARLNSCRRAGRPVFVNELVAALSSRILIAFRPLKSIMSTFISDAYTEHAFLRWAWIRHCVLTLHDPTT
jgi:hypothetical protein